MGSVHLLFNKQKYVGKKIIHTENMFWQTSKCKKCSAPPLSPGTANQNWQTFILSTAHVIVKAAGKNYVKIWHLLAKKAGAAEFVVIFWQLITKSNLSVHFCDNLAWSAHAPPHTESFKWFLSVIEGIFNFEFCY